METKSIFNSYGCFFQNGNYSNGRPILYKLVYFTTKNYDDFAIFQRGENNYCIGHLCNFDTDNFQVSWAWGHYDFTTIENAKKFIKNFFNK